jgi:hypothetical protein
MLHGEILRRTKNGKWTAGNAVTQANPACEQAMRNAQEGARMIACVTIKNREEK